MKRFSIIMCAYNIEKYISDSIESVLEQDFDDYELIIVNDGSKDGTLKEIKKYKDSRISIINSRKNVGAGAARNIGVKAAEGEYIIYLDGDDTLYENSTLSKINEVIEKNENPDITYFGVQYIGGSNKAYLPTAENSTKEARITCDMHFPVASKCWRRKFLEEKNITFVENMYYEDMAYSIKAVILAEKIAYASFPVYNYIRNREGSIMSTPTVKRCSDMYRIVSYILDLYDITPDEYKPYLLSFVKNEVSSIPTKTKAILKAMKENTGSPVFPKRNYIFDDTDEEVKV